MTDDGLAQELINMTEQDRQLQGGALGDGPGRVLRAPVRAPGNDVTGTGG